MLCTLSRVSYIANNNSDKIERRCSKTRLAGPLAPQPQWAREPSGGGGLQRHSAACRVAHHAGTRPCGAAAGAEPEENCRLVL